MIFSQTKYTGLKLFSAILKDVGRFPRKSRTFCQKSAVLVIRCLVSWVPLAKLGVAWKAL